MMDRRALGTIQLATGVFPQRLSFRNVSTLQQDASSRPPSRDCAGGDGRESWRACAAQLGVISSSRALFLGRKNAKQSAVEVLLEEVSVP